METGKGLAFLNLMDEIHARRWSISLACARGPAKVPRVAMDLISHDLKEQSSDAASQGQVKILVVRKISLRSRISVHAPCKR
jgi:hypothetical protein